MKLIKVDLSNVWEIIKLDVKDTQKNFVAPNNISIIEAYATIQSGYVALPFGIFEDDKYVGFVMLGYGTNGDEDEPEIVHQNYCIWRFMIDERYQGLGYGKKAMECVMEYIKTFPCGEAQYCWLSYEPENIDAKALYAKFGFEENGDMSGDEIVAVCSIK